MSANACFTWSKSLSATLTIESLRMHNQVSVKYFPLPWFILLSMVTDFLLSVVKVEGFTRKYASMAFTQWIAFSVSPEKLAGRAALTSLVLVVVDMEFIDGGGGLAGGCGGGTVGGGAVVNEVDIVMTGGTEVTRGVTGGKGLAWELEGGNAATCLGGRAVMQG